MNNQNQLLEVKLNEANMKIMMKKYHEAEEIYQYINEYFDDYRSWVGLFNLLALQNISKEDERYLDYYKRAILMCKSIDEVKTVNEIFYSLMDIKVSKNASIAECATDEGSNDSLDNTVVNQNQKELIIPKEEIESWNKTGEELTKKNKLREAIMWFTKAADKGCAAAQHNLATCYQKAKVVPYDYKKSFEYYMKAANQGYMESQHCLGDIYYTGKGVTKDYAKAVYWWGKSAKQGHSLSQFDLGYCYQHGHGVEKDDKQAKYWYGLSASQGVSIAITALKQFN